MTPLTQARIDLTLLALRERQLLGEAPPPGSVATEYLARLSREIGAPVSHESFRRVERIALARLRHQLDPETTR